MISIPIYFYDLTEDKQKEILTVMNITRDVDYNWDVLPLTYYDFEEEEEY